MSTVINLDDARARGVALPADDGVAQDILDEQEAWLERKIGPLLGSRTESFYVGIGITTGKLGLGRCTDAIATVVDGGAGLDPTRFQLIDKGGSVARTYYAVSPYWAGPYVGVTYEPNDEELIRSVLYDLVALKATPATGYESERIGDYSYTKAGQNGQSLEGIRAGLVAGILPKRDSMATLAVSRRTSAYDPVINRAETEFVP